MKIEKDRRDREEKELEKKIQRLRKDITAVDYSSKVLKSIAKKADSVDGQSSISISSSTTHNIPR